MKSTGQDQREIGEDGREGKLEVGELLRQSRRKKKKINKKDQDIKSRQKKTMK